MVLGLSLMDGSPSILASLPDEDITMTCDIIRKPGGLVDGRALDRGNQIPIMVAKNLKFATFMFKSMEHGSKAYSI